MPKEYITEVLDKFAQVTSILVESSKIKEFLDSKCKGDGDLKVVLERTKTQVDNLCEHASTVKDLFYNQYKEVSQQLDAVNGKVSGDDEQNGFVSDPLGSEGVKQCEVSSTKNDSNDKKPLIKLVDINKLVEPKSVIKKDSSTIKGKKNVDFNATVVIISSSDEEPTRTASKRKAAKKTIKKTRAALREDRSSDSDFSDAGMKTRKNKTKNGSKRKANLDEKIELSETSSDWSDDDLSSVKSSRRHNNKKKNREPPKNEASESLNLDWKNDPKFNNKCYVKVLRIPCEKLKEYYLEKLDLLEVKKLSDLSTLKRKKKKSGSEKSSDSEDNTAKKKRKTTEKSKKTNEDDDDSSTTDIDVPDAEDTTAPSEEIPTATSSLNEANNAIAEDALQLLNSDKEDNKGDSSEEEASPPKEKEPTSEETVFEKQDEDNEAQKEKQNEVNEAQKEIEDENDTPKEKEVEEKNDTGKEKEDDTSKPITESESEDKNDKDKDKSKKAWKKDKLLTAKLSSTDTEEELEKFQKKKEKMQDEVLSDEEPKTKDKKKRILKKRMKKKKILSDSESDNKKDSSDEFQKSSSSSSSESEKEEEKEDEEKKKPARKRVKRVRDSSEDDEEKSTRKQIRNIWGRDSLAETTKKAEAEEKERKARIAEKQKKYNQIYDNTYDLNAKVDKVVLDIDEKNNKELLRVDDEIVKKLKPHQASGLQFMWDACFESLERAKNTKGSGCILAHCMGLGKTLQVIALTHTLLINSEETNVRKVMVVSPLNTVLNWVNEYKQWLPDLDDFEIYELVSSKQNYERLYQVKTWHTHGGVLIIGYDMFRNLSNPDNKRISKKMRATFQEAMVDPGPDLVICDEGHLLKNEKTNLSIAMNRLKTLRRIVLTGTPLQNNLKEYFCMVQFIKPNLLGTYKEYLNRFVNPITNGQYTDSTPHDIQIMRRRSHVLHKMLDGIVQRRDYSVLAPYLPPKYEYVLFLNLTEVQIKLYTHYMEHFARRATGGSNRTSFLFVDFQELQRICTHPRVLLDRSNQMKLAKEKDQETDEESEGSLKDFIDDDDEEASSTSSSGSDDDENEGKEKKSNASNKKRLTRAAAALAKENGEDVVILEDSVNEQEKEWWQEYCDGDELNEIKHGSKLFLLFEILKECEQIGDKVLVFSQSLYSLNIIEYFLGRIHDATQDDQTDTVGGYSGSWCLGLDYFRLDGSSSCDNRSTWCKTFNDPANTRARLFLISTKAGGLGINLVAANRVIIFDVSWNPSHDIQSIYRVYRFGQTKPCYIYRFVTNGTMEMKIYERQVTKQAISKRVIDEQQIDRHYNQNDLAELYKFDPSPEDRPTPLVPKDVLLGELLQNFEDRIYKYHEHQTLLENKEDEGLNEEERKAAWEEFENEKKQRNMGFGNYGRQSMNWEQAFINVIKKDNPGWSDAEARAIIPALQLQLQEQLKQKDYTVYRKIQQEMQMIQAVQNQKLREQFYAQQAVARMMQQQQQQIAALKLQNPGNYLQQYMNQMPSGSSTPTNTAYLTRGIIPNPKANEVIDLND